MALVAGYLRARQARRHRARVFRPRKCLADFNDVDVELQAYRLPRAMIDDLARQYAASEWANRTRRSNAVSPETEMLVALRYYAKGGFLSEVGAIHGVSRAAVSRILDKVGRFFVSIAPDHIQYPDGRDELIGIVRKFEDLAGMPCTMGAVDGTQIPIRAPDRLEHVYANRKGYHSINVQVVCDADQIIRACEARWPGTSHDAYIFNFSEIKEKLENGDFQGYWLLGDSGYPLKEYLLTPLTATATAAERRYNIVHRRTRFIVECCLGVLKSRFRCLHKSGGNMQLNPSTCCKTITACMVLHNMCKRAGLADPEVDAAAAAGQPDVDAPAVAVAPQDADVEVRRDRASGVRVRQQLITDRFVH